MLPAIISQCVVALKDTSLGYAVAAPGLTASASRSTASSTTRCRRSSCWPPSTSRVNLVLTAIATWVQKKFVGEKKPLEVSMVGHLDDGRAV